MPRLVEEVPSGLCTTISTPRMLQVAPVPAPAQSSRWFRGSETMLAQTASADPSPVGTAMSATDREPALPSLWWLTSLTFFRTSRPPCAIAQHLLSCVPGGVGGRWSLQFDWATPGATFVANEMLSRLLTCAAPRT